MRLNVLASKRWKALLPTDRIKKRIAKELLDIVLTALFDGTGKKLEIFKTFACFFIMSFIFIYKIP